MRDDRFNMVMPDDMVIDFVHRGYHCRIVWNYNALDGVTVSGGIALDWTWEREPVYRYVISAPSYYNKSDDPIGGTFDKVHNHLDTYIDSHERNKK